MSAPDPARLGAAHGYADAAARLAPLGAEAARAAKAEGLAPEDAAYVSARLAALREVYAWIAEKQKETRA